MKLTVPAHRPIKPSTLAHILKQAGLGLEAFLQLL
jgi:predicted RNA binding protein YcfA (HicA-like mRNA interferase family)